MEKAAHAYIWYVTFFNLFFFLLGSTPQLIFFFLIFKTGRQLFERNRNLEDESLVEEEGESVDFSQYERVRQFEEDEERVAFEPDPESD